MQCGSMRIKSSKRRGSKQIKKRTVRSAVKSKCRDYLQTKIKNELISYSLKEDCFAT